MYKELTAEEATATEFLVELMDERTMSGRGLSTGVQASST
jgi:hypothetical protein